LGTTAGKSELGVRGRYENDILAYAGVRLIESERYNPKKKVFNQEIKPIHELEPIEVAEVEAEDFKYEHDNRCHIWAGEGGQWFVKFKKGARVFQVQPYQMPTGWNAGRYGMSVDITDQTDRTMLRALVCTAKALNQLASSMRASKSQNLRSVLCTHFNLS